MTAKSTGGAALFKSFGFGSQTGDDFESKMVTDRNANDPSRKEDIELGIDRSMVDPIKFVSAIDSKPIYPPYLQLADFESYLLQDGDDQKIVADKKKDAAGGATAGEKDADGTQTVTSNKQKSKAATDDPADYKAEMEEFRENIGEMYYEKAVKLMEQVEERRRDEERSMITIQLSKYKKSLTKKEKGDADSKQKGAVTDAASNKEEKKEPVPALDENAIRDRIEKAG